MPLLDKMPLSNNKEKLHISVQVPKNLKDAGTRILYKHGWTWTDLVISAIKQLIEEDKKG